MRYSFYPQTRPARAALASGLLLLLCGLCAKSDTTPKNHSAKVGKIPLAAGANTKTNKAVAPAQLAYQFTLGSVTHFKVNAFFDGHFPPFAQPDSPPVHFKAELGYTATVKKVDKEGATVEFVVDSHELYLFKSEVGENQKVDLDSEDVVLMSGLTTLQDMQKALNATAILRSDGSIVRILTSSSVKIPFDVGFDIRKLFLMMLPVTFPVQAIKPGDTWPATDGLLGAKPGKTVYTDRLDSAIGGANTTYRLSQRAHADIEDKLDKAGNSAGKDAEVYRTLSGKVDLTSEMTFVVPAAPAQKATLKTPAGKTARGATQAVPVPAGETAQAGQVQSAHLVMNAVIVRKRVKINPEQPEIPETDPLDVKARMTVTRLPDAPKHVALSDRKAK